MRFMLLFTLFLLVTQTFAQKLVNPPRGELRVILLSDFNGSYGATDYSPAVARVLDATVQVWQPDLFLSAGDVVAGQKASLPDARFAEMWEAFDRVVARPLRDAGIPYAFAVGNHDGSSGRRADGSFVYARERDAAGAYWSGPQHEENLAYHDKADFPFNYSFVFTPSTRPDKAVFVLVWDASSATLTKAQRAWVEGELGSPAAQEAALRLVVGHLPLYGVSAEKNKSGEVLANGDALRELLERYGVHTYISGHHAAYFPGKRGALELLHTGGVGARQLLGSDAPPRSTVTVMDVDFEPLDVRHTTFDVLSFEEISLESLPEHIRGLNGTVIRRDLEP